MRTRRPKVAKVHAQNYGVYGARKVWLQLNRERPADADPIARCTVERLMGELGLRGAIRGKVKRTTIADPTAARPADLVARRFAPLAPDRLWVADFTYVSMWAGWVYVAFVIDAYARRIIGWRTSTSMTAQLVLDAIEHAVWTRAREGREVDGVIQHHDHGSQYTSVAYSERLAADGIRPSMGVVGSSYDNALAETINGLYKTELIKARGPWRPSTRSRSPPPSGSTGSTTDASTSTAATCRPPRWKPPTTLNNRPRHSSRSPTRKSPDSPGRFNLMLFAERGHRSTGRVVGPLDDRETDTGIDRLIGSRHRHREPEVSPPSTLVVSPMS